MPTSKRRISIVSDDQLFHELEAVARRRRRPVASVTVELLRRALELEEDAHFSRVADERLAGKEKRISHSRAWK
jgi:hypothetical protein